LFEFQAVTIQELEELAHTIHEHLQMEGKGMHEVGELAIPLAGNIKSVLERLNVPHKVINGNIVVSQDYAKSLLVSLGFVDTNGKIDGASAIANIERYVEKAQSALELANAVSQVKLEKRSTFIGARIGRPEKARERLMQPAPNALFPIGDYGGRDRNITDAYEKEEKKFGDKKIKVEIARYKCDTCGRIVGMPYCYDCGRPTRIERVDSDEKAYDEIEIDIDKMMTGAMKRLGLVKLPNLVKGVKGLINKDKIAEPIEKGILRAIYGVYTFKDGTSRFDATDAPITHFYPREIGTDIETLKRLGYDKDYLGRDLTSDDQLIELKHQDVIINKRGAEYFVKVAKFVDAVA